MAAAAAPAFFAAAPLTAAGLAAPELFGLNKPPSENFSGDGEGLIAVSVFVRPRLVFGVAAGDVPGDAAGLASVAASAFLRPRLAFGAAAGDSADVGDAAVSLVEAVASAFLRPRCFVGDSPGLGD